MNKYFLEGVNSDYNDSNPHGLRGVSGPAGITPEWEAWREGHQAVWGNLELLIAQQIYDSRKDQYEEAGGFFEMKEWEDLEPHEHDDYRTNASYVIESLNDLGILSVARLRLAAIAMEKARCS